MLGALGQQLGDDPLVAFRIALPPALVVGPATLLIVAARVGQSEVRQVVGAAVPAGTDVFQRRAVAGGRIE